MIKWFAALLVTSLCCYISRFTSPVVFWPAIFFALLTPVVLAVNVLLTILLLVKRSKLVFFPAIGLVAGIFLTGQTMTFHADRETDKNDISVLSFNAKFFRKPDTYRQFSTDMIQWVVNDSSKIKCIQEYSTNRIWPALDVTGMLEKRGYYNFHIKSKMKENDHGNGLVIFSLYPIINSGIVVDIDTTSNGVIFADLNLGNDTLRIYNVHFESMNLTRHEFISKLKNGSIKRMEQWRSLLANTQTCPYRFIICGDFNETPYSNSYWNLTSAFSNSFEAAGNGFGFTLNSSLFFLRIDHQFFNKGVACKSYRVDRSMSISDHFPTFGYYRVSK